MKISRKSLKSYLISNMITFTVLTTVFYINYQSNNSSIFAIENFTLVIGIAVLIVSIASYISIKIYEKKNK